MASLSKAFAVFLLLLCCSSMVFASFDTIASSNLSFSASEDWSVQLRALSQTTLDACLKTAGITYVKKGDASYEALRQRNDNGAFANKYPQYIISPSSEANVAATLTCLNKFSTPFVVRSGGHSYRGMSILNCGAVIDTYNLRSVKFNGGNSVTVGAGMRLGPLYRELWLNGNKIFPAGTCPAVGLSGLLLSAGKGLASRKLGFSVDNLESARVALASGKVVTASSSQNSDLFYAIRGGGGSYGLVTSWTLKVHDAPKSYTQLEIGWPWNADTAKKVGNEMFKAKPWNWPESVSIIRLYYQPGSLNPIRVVVHYWGTKVEMQAFMKSVSFFTSIPKYTEILFKQGSYIDAQLRAAALGSNAQFTLDSLKGSRVSKPSGSKAYISAYVPKSIPAAGVDVMVNFANSGGAVTMTFLGGAIKSFSGTATDAHRNQLLVIQFLSSGNDRETKISTLTNQFKPYNQGEQYLGYFGAIPSGADPWQVFFGSNAGTLKNIRNKYDPNGRFGALKLPACK